VPQNNARSLVLRHIESVWNHGDWSALQELTTPEFRYYFGSQPGRDRYDLEQFVTTVRQAFPDWRVQVEEIFAEGGLVAVRWRGEVTHLGAFQGIPPTGRRIIVRGINLYRVDAGKVAEEWEQTDSLSILRQLGALPN
jgi:steroid delta-isomerase-like uncharacterized protein